LKNGDVLYRVNNVPVVLLDGTAVLWRTLSVGDSGADVKAVERALHALGYDDDGAMTVDTEYTSATAAAVKEFQAAKGLSKTGSLTPESVVMHNGPVVAATIVAAVGDSVASDTEIIDIAETSRDVTFAIDASQLASIAVGDTTSVSLPQGGTAKAKVTSVAAAPSTDGTFAVTARVADNDVVGDSWDVTVKFSHVLVKDALLVDPSALIMVEGGGTELRVRRGDTVDSVSVTILGTASRETAIASEDLAAGDVVIP